MLFSTIDVDVPEQIVSDDGEAEATGIGLTVTTTIFETVGEHTPLVTKAL